MESGLILLFSLKFFNTPGKREREREREREKERGTQIKRERQKDRQREKRERIIEVEGKFHTDKKLWNLIHRK